MIGLTDRLRLRPMIAATSDNRPYISSEEAPIRLVKPDLDRLWSPVGGKPVIGRVGTPAQAQAPFIAPRQRTQMSVVA